ncbi:alpha/beta hydrolase [Maricaulis sp. D1M11]|uniref:alpha/beta hydrolase n=1 Tax=Maricaulis sp. D1M11 TaxID=3076117 RepID=UPI0039B44048
MNAAAEDALIQQLAEGVSHSFRTPVLRRPSDYGMDYEDIFFPAMDGVMLDGWFIPAPGSRKLVICNHFIGANRYGYPGHLEPWDQAGGFEVNFVEIYKHLHEAGYNVLAYDLRGHGLSANGAGTICGVGSIEWRDVIGSVRYARQRADWAGMEIALHSLCMGCNATFKAMALHPEEFGEIACMIAVQPLSAPPFLQAALTDHGVENAEARFDAAYSRITGFRASDQSAVRDAPHVPCPVMLVQVKDDVTTKAYDAENIVAAFPNPAKKLLWIEGTSVRYEGYRYFARQPEKMIDWYHRHLGQ